MKTALLIVASLSMALAADAPKPPVGPVQPKPKAMPSVRTKKPVVVVAKATARPPLAVTLDMRDRDVKEIDTKINFDTWIVLPQGEYITDAGSGDPENWAMQNGSPKRPSNIFHVKPAVRDTETDLHLVTNQKRVLSFLVREISTSCPGCRPTLKVFVEPFVEPPSIQMSMDAKPAPDPEQAKRIVELKAQIRDLESSRDSDRREAQKKLTAAVNNARENAPLELRCDYDFKLNRKPTLVEAICTDGSFTYIKSGGEGVASVYATPLMGKPMIVQSVYKRGETSHDGTYVVKGILTRGYLREQGKKLAFQTKAKE